jgi:uncharacterized protein YlxW (UPF0749 family)
MKRSYIMILIFCFLLAFSGVVLARMTNGQHLYVSPKVIDDYRVTIKGERKDMEKQKVLVDEARAKVSQYEALLAADQDVSREVKKQTEEDLALYKIASGDFDVRGPGVTVYIDDSKRNLEDWETPNDILVHDSDLLLIIDELNASGAEAVSVNGQRITDLSSIACSGYTVRINGQFFARPFEIQAIGDGSRMSAALVGPGGYGTILKDWGLIFKVNVEDDILIPAYTEDHSYKYMKAVVK